MNDTNTTGFEAGELVNVHINGVRYAADDPGYGVRFDAADPDLSFWLKPGLPHVIERVAPKEWPPQPGDIWADRDGADWVARIEPNRNDVYRTLLARVDASKGGRWGGEPADVAANHGPMTLAYRRGWTPGQPSTVDEPERDGRAAFIGGLRGLVDFLNAHPEIPHPDAAPCQYSVIGYMGLHSPALAEPARLAEALRVATLIGSELNDDLTARRSFGGGVEYIVHTYRDTVQPDPADEASDEPVEVAP